MSAGQQNMAAPDRLVWVDILRGVTILLVVMNHVSLVDMSTGANYEAVYRIASLFGPLRMPLFMFVSGAMLYKTRIARNFTILSFYKDKFKRLFVPYAFFVVVYYVIHFLMTLLSGGEAQISIQSIFDAYVIFKKGSPAFYLWFIVTLMDLMLLYPIFRWACSNRYAQIVILMVGVGIYFVPPDFFATRVFALYKFPQYLVFFFLGMVCFEKKLHERLSDWRLGLVCFAGYVVSYYYGFGFLQRVLSIFVFVSLAINLSTWMPRLFSSFRGHSYQIYLTSLPCQWMVEIVLWKHIFYDERLFWLFYILSVLAGVYVPVFLSKLVMLSENKAIRMCFGVK